jgi:glucose/arabinose dehydrogenase/PKD repeat protein
MASRRLIGLRLALAGLAALSCFAPRPVPAVPSLPPGFAAIEVGPSGDWDTPVGIAFAPDGRLFVIEKRGRVHIVENDVKLPVPFLEIEAEVLNNGDRGLLGIAVDPDFAANGRVYLLYTVDPDGDGVDDEGPAFGRLVRYTASAADPNRAEPGSRLVLLGDTWRSGIASCSQTHAIGALRFGADGSLLLSVGDGATASGADAGGRHSGCFGANRTDPAEDIGSFRSQWIGSLAGKILRLDPSTGGGLLTNPYFTGNPFDAASRVWAYGLRNPFRFCVRPGTGSPDPGDGLPGTLYVGDVGWVTWEEVTVTRPGGGGNHGWPCREGFSAPADYQSAAPAHHGCGTMGTPDNPGPIRLPIASWHHATASLSTPAGLAGKCVGAAAFYVGDAYPAQYRGACFFAEYDQSWIKAARVDGDDNLIQVLDFAAEADGPVDLAADPANGDLHFVSIRRGQIWRIRYDPSNRPPEARAAAVPASGEAPLLVEFSSAGSNDPDGDALAYRWSFGDGGTSVDADPSHTYLSAGSYTAVLTVGDGRGGQGSAVATVDVGGAQAGNTAPAATIMEPLDDAFFLYGAEIQLRGTAADQEDPLKDLEFDWEVILHHNTHVHPSWLLLEGAATKFLPHDHDDGTGTWFEIVLRVRDRGGLVGTDSVSIRPDDQALVLDNGDPGTSFTGSWPASGGVFPYGSSSLYSNSAGRTYTYTFPIPSPGAYKVFAWWTNWPSRSTAVPYTVSYIGGSETVVVDQLDPAYSDRWNLLGTYGFGSIARVTITAVGEAKTVCADAVCLIRTVAGNSPPSAAIDLVSPNPADLGETVAFSGHGEDDDGTVTGYHWRSSIDGSLSDQPSFSSSALSPGLHTIYFRVEDDQGAWSPEATVVLDVQAPAPEEIILDNGQPGTTAVGGWSVSGGESPYGSNALYSKATGAHYTFRPAVARPGTYDVYAWWTVIASRTTAAPYTITHAGGTSTVTANQRLDGGRWNLLGTYSFDPGAAAIRVNSVAAGFSTCADAVRLVLRGAGGPAPVERVLDNGDPGTSSTGSWLLSGGAQPYGANSIYAKNSAATYTYSVTLPQAGTYEVFAWWTTLASRSPAVTYRIAHSGGTASVVRSQKADGGRWNSLGVLSFAGTAAVTIVAPADGYSYSADAVRLVLVGP